MRLAVGSLAGAPALPWTLSAITLALFALPIALSGPSTLTDDYYYYERIARHLIAGDGSTYDGVVDTNGYHPLWMLCVVVAVALERITGLAAQSWSLAFCAALALAALWLVWRRALSRTPAFAAGLLLLCTYGIFFGVMAMETSLLLLFGALFFLRVRDTGGELDFHAGVCIAMCFLSRLDSLVYFLPLIGWLWLLTPWRRKLSFAAPILAVIALYCGFSILHFGMPMPVSGAAKAVREMSGIHPAAWVQLTLGRQNQLMILGAALLTAFALVQGPQRRRVHVALSALGVLLFFTATSIRSDWVVLEWYLFPFALHVMYLVTAETAGADRGFAKALGAAALIAAIGALALVGFRNARHAERQHALVEAAQRVARLVANEPRAVIAMGDRAGAVGQALPNRLIQLEGLVMDRAYLQRLSGADSIVPLLRGYGVSYYVATAPRREADGCYTTWEPSQSRGASIRVTTRLCAAVADEFVIDGTRTVVFRAPFAGAISVAGPADSGGPATR